VSRTAETEAGVVESVSLLDFPVQAPAPPEDLAPQPQPAPSRLAFIDVLRGVAMVLMALDHTRDFFSGAHFAPEDLAHTTGPIFFTRWVTHFCAPLFFLLAGTGAYLSLSRGKSPDQVFRFLWTRGLWLVFLDLTVVTFAWTSGLPLLVGGVLWSLGWSMVAMAFLSRLPVRWIAALGAGLILTHNLLDRVNPASLGKFGGLWIMLHGQGDFWIAPGKEAFFVMFPLIPWLGVMAVGYALGALMKKKGWAEICFGIGLALTVSFFVLRGFHLYGNSHRHLNGPAAGRWRLQPTMLLTLASFLDTLKYPPSLQYLLMTLGPSLMVLATLSTVNLDRWPARIMATFGRVPLFYYVVHLYLIRTLAVYTAMAFKQKAAWLLYGGVLMSLPPAGYGHRLPFIFGMWFVVLLIMYPLCALFARVKQRHASSWWAPYV
jgi:uncharacterized membrane protein